MDLLLNKAYLLGIHDLNKWADWMNLEGEVEHVSKSKEARREACREVAKEGPHTMVAARRGLSDSERAYISAYQEQ